MIAGCRILWPVRCERGLLGLRERPPLLPARGATMGQGASWAKSQRAWTTHGLKTAGLSLLATPGHLLPDFTSRTHLHPRSPCCRALLPAPGPGPQAHTGRATRRGIGPHQSSAGTRHTPQGGDLPNPCIPAGPAPSPAASRAWTNREAKNYSRCLGGWRPFPAWGPKRWPKGASQPVPPVRPRGCITVSLSPSSRIICSSLVLFLCK